MKTNFLNTRNLINKTWRYTALLGLCLCGTVSAVAGNSYAGFYSGTYATTSGTSDHGNIALFVDAGGTAAVVIDSLVSNSGNGGFEDNIPVSSSGTVNYTTSDGTVISASISGGTLTGTWSSIYDSGSFTASARSATGSYQSSAGYYAGSVTSGGGSSDLRVILAPDGTFYGGVNDNSGNGNDGFTGTMSGNTFSFISSGGTSVNGTLNTTSFLFVGNYNSGGNSGTFTLSRIDTVTSVSSGSYTLTPAAVNFSATAGSGSFSVTTGSGNSWSATANQSWIQTSSTGTGNGTVNYTVDANPNAAFRTGTISVGNQTFTLTQGPSGFAWNNAFGWIFSAGSGWYHANGFGWMWFSSGQWIWSGSLQGWVAITDPNSSTIWSTQFRWLTPSATDPYQADTTAIGPIYVGQYNGTVIPDGWVVSSRFGYVWAVGDGVWFWSDGLKSWLGVTPDGGIWCVSQGKFL